MKLCIVKLSAMGDIIHCMVALQFIKQKYPNIQIDWIVEEGFKSVLENNPHIDNILPIKLKAIKKNKITIFQQIALLKKYRQNNYDLVIDAQGLLKSAIVAKIIAKKELAGFDKNSIREKVASLFYSKKVNIGYEENTIDRNVKVMCFALDIEVSHQQIVNKQKFLFCNNNKIQKESYNLFVIGSTWESRNYPKEKFVEIANKLKVTTYIVWGSEEEKEKAIWMQKQSAFLKVLPKGNLDTLKSVIENSQLLIGNDTGPTHMAWGLNVPSVTIFGPTPTNRVYVTPINKVIKSSSKINHHKLNKNDFSIKEIKVQEILNTINTIQEKPNEQ